MTQEITEDATSIDASRWNSGTYIWKLKTENGKLKVGLNVNRQRSTDNSFLESENLKKSVFIREICGRKI